MNSFSFSFFLLVCFLFSSSLSFSAFYGRYDVSSGHFSGEDEYREFNYAYYDLMEFNYRSVLGRFGYNTFDPSLVNRLEFVLDNRSYSRFDSDEFNDGFFFHVNFTIDPWSFTSKKSISIDDSGGNSFTVNLRALGGYPYAIGDTVWAKEEPIHYSFPDISLKGTETESINVYRYKADGTTKVSTLTIPSEQLDTYFWPIRELFLGWESDVSQFYVFPFAYSDVIEVSPDPLQLSGRKIYWEPSPWLSNWVEGYPDWEVMLPHQKSGYWDTVLPFISRDSDGKFLTPLRGIKYKFYDRSLGVSVYSMLASPKTLWQDYSDISTLSGTFWVDVDLPYGHQTGWIYNFRRGFTDKNKGDALENLFSVHASFILPYRVLFKMQFSFSTLEYNKHSAVQDALIKDRGKSIFLQLGIKRWITNEMQFSYARLDSNFTGVLSNFRYTRDDEFWSTHLSFYSSESSVSSLYNKLTYEPSFSFKDVESFRLGDGIDAGRSTIRYQLGDLLFHGSLELNLDIRHVNSTRDNSHIETVYRVEIVYNPKNLLDWMRIKSLVYFRQLPITESGYDPFLHHYITDQPLKNPDIVGGEDPSVRVLSLGIDCDLSSWIRIYGIYEHTNIYNLYPRDVMQFFDNLSETTLTNTHLFEVAPYPFYSIYKIGSQINILDNLQCAINMTVNQDDKALNIDDNVNHISTNLLYVYSRNLKFSFHYVYTTLKILEQQSSEVQYSNKNAYNNFAVNVAWRFKRSEFIFQYGVSNTYDVLQSFNLGRSPNVLESQKIVKLLMKGQF